MALCPNCSIHLPKRAGICLSCGAVIDRAKFSVHSPMSEEASGGKRQVAASRQTPMLVKSSLGSSLRENESEAEGKPDNQKRENQQ